MAERKCVRVRRMVGRKMYEECGVHRGGHWPCAQTAPASPSPVPPPGLRDQIAAALGTVDAAIGGWARTCAVVDAVLPVVTAARAAAQRAAWDEGWAACANWWHGFNSGNQNAANADNPYTPTPPVPPGPEDTAEAPAAEPTPESLRAQPHPFVPACRQCWGEATHPVHRAAEDAPDSRVDGGMRMRLGRHQAKNLYLHRDGDDTGELVGQAQREDVAHEIAFRWNGGALALRTALDAARATITARDSEISRLTAVRADNSRLRAERAAAWRERDEWKAGHARALRDREAVEQEMDRRIEAVATERDEAARLAADRYDQLAKLQHAARRQALELATQRDTARAALARVEALPERFDAIASDCSYGAPEDATTAWLTAASHLRAALRGGGDSADTRAERNPLWELALTMPPIAPHPYRGTKGLIGGSCLDCSQLSSHPAHNPAPAAGGTTGATT